MIVEWVLSDKSTLLVPDLSDQRMYELPTKRNGHADMCLQFPRFGHLYDEMNIMSTFNDLLSLNAFI